MREKLIVVVKYYGLVRLVFVSFNFVFWLSLRYRLCDRARITPELYLLSCFFSTFLKTNLKISFNLIVLGYKQKICVKAPFSTNFTKTNKKFHFHRF